MQENLSTYADEIIKKIKLIPKTLLIDIVNEYDNNCTKEEQKLIETLKTELKFRKGESNEHKPSTHTSSKKRVATTRRVGNKKRSR